MASEDELIVEQHGPESQVWAEQQVRSYFATEVDIELTFYRRLAAQREPLAHASTKHDGRRRFTGAGVTGFGALL